MRQISSILPAVVVLTTLTASAQQQAPRKIAPGAVTGHVFCQDTQRPARLAKVALVAAPKLGQLSAKEQERADQIGSATATDFVETGLDGNFRIADVKPGEYFLIVDKEGYTLPLGQFTHKDLTSADEPTRMRVAKLVKPILVASDQTVIQDVTLERGAAVSGTVTYDDGSPAAGLVVEVLTRDDKGKWVAGITGRYRSTFGRLKTDDQGRYRLTGLPPGEYVTEVDLTLNEYTTTTTSMPGAPDQTTVMRMEKTKYSLPLFSGNALRSQNSTPYTLGSGEERTGSDLQFPLSKLHRVTGQLLARDGHALNAGKVTVVNADDQSKVTEAEVEFADSAFHLEFVPEGNFILKVSGARDVAHVQVENAAGTVPRFRTEDKTTRSYGEAQQPLLVNGEIVGVNVPVPDPGTGNKPDPKAAGSQ